MIVKSYEIKLVYKGNFLDILTGSGITASKFDSSFNKRKKKIFPLPFN